MLKHYVLENKWIPKRPHPVNNKSGPTTKQAEFLCLTCIEALYGGAAGGGKSDALLMGGLMFVDVPNYSAILFRRTYADLALPGALMDRALEWLGGTSAHWDSMKHIWRFPSGATLTFGNLEREQDKYRYQSAEFQYIGFDELTQFTESQYRYLFSRLRRLENVEQLPLRMRSASNPGNIGHDWVKRRFLDEGQKYGRVFIPAKLQDNPYLDREGYVESLRELDPITRRQYLEGDWTARHGGSIFLREWFQIVNEPPARIRKVRYWDLAATKPKQGTDPDYTVGALLGEKDGVYYVINIIRFRGAPPQVEATIKQTASLDGYDTRIYMEQEPGSSGVAQIDYYARQVLKGYSFWGVKTTGPKEERATPVSSAAEAGNIKLVNGKWINAFLDEFEAFPMGMHDDQVDAVSGAFEQLRAHGLIDVGTANIPW
jgi:predicted phage terminase large subunit-like protein